MSKLIGTTLNLETPHPQEFVDLLYEEIYDHHDPDAEIDVIFAVRFPNGEEIDDRALVMDGDNDADERAKNEIHSVTIVDFRTFRVDDEVLIDGEREEPYRMLLAMDEWGRNVPNSDAYMWFHKHPEGAPFPSSKDESWTHALGSIDFGRTPIEEGRKRYFTLAIVINRNASMPISLPNSPEATGVEEIDRLVFEKTNAMSKKRFGIDEDHEYVRLGRELFEDALGAHKFATDDNPMAAMQAMMASLPKMQRMKELEAELLAGKRPQPMRLLDLPELDLGTTEYRWN